MPEGTPEGMPERRACWARPAIALLLAALAAGCAGGRPRPTGPEAAVRLPTLLAQADSAAARGEAAEAKAAYARAAEAARRAGLRDLELRADLGSALASLATGDAEAARRAALRSVELDPRSAPAHVALGRTYAAIRRYRDAKAAFDRAAALDSVSAEPLYRLGLAYAEAGESKLAEDTFSRALARDPSHAPSLAALRQISEARYSAAGIPAGYAAIREHAMVTRGELGVLLAAELGADPDRPSWRGSATNPSDTEEARDAWGERLLRAAMARGWITPYPDGFYHLGDPVTRGALALTVVRIERERPPGAAPDSLPRGMSGPDRFPDLGPRHYLLRSAQAAVRLGLPVHAGGRFDPWASSSGLEALLTLRGLARSIGAQPIMPEESSVGGTAK